MDESLAPETRAGLLANLARREPALALPIASAWSEMDDADDRPTALRRMGLDILLGLDPEKAWPLIESAYRNEGGEILRELPSLWQRRDGRHADLAAWPTSRLERLGRMLQEAYPLVSAPKIESMTMSPVPLDDELRLARVRVLNVLLDRRMGGDPEALASLLDIEPRLRERYESELKQQEAFQLLLDLRRKEESLRSISDRASIPLDRVVRLLDETDYRLIRSDDDLLEALVEMITKIGTEAAYDLSMLYGKPEPEEKQGEKATGGIKSKVKKAKKKANVRRRLDEDALPGIRPPPTQRHAPGPHPRRRDRGHPRAPGRVPATAST